MLFFNLKKNRILIKKKKKKKYDVQEQVMYTKHIILM